MKTKLFSILCLASILAGNSQSLKNQTYESLLPKYTIAIQPLNLLNAELRVDFERQLINPENWLQIHISGVYLPEIEADKSQLRSYRNFLMNYKGLLGLQGGGAGIAYKLLFGTQTSFYGTLGINYNFYNVKYQDVALIPFEENGSTKYLSTYGVFNPNFHRIKPNINLGVQSSLTNLFFYDLYFGVGYAYSLYDKDLKPFNTGILNFGYNGFTISAGVRIGFTFGRFTKVVM